MGAEHTSVPRWPAQVPPPDPAARSLALLGFGATGERAVRAWRQQVDAGIPVWSRTADRAGTDVLAELEQQVAQAVVGWRLLLAGPEADVLAARAVAVRLGVIDAEIRMAVDDATRKRVYCAHCAVT